MTNSSLVLTVFHRFFTWIALGDLDLCSLLMLVKKPMIKRKLRQSHAYIINVIKPYKWLMVWQLCHFLLPSYRR